MIVAICTTLLTGAMSILTSLEQPCRDFAKACDAVTVKVYPYTDDEAKISEMGEKFKALPDVERVEYVRNHAIDENIFLNGKKVILFVNLTEYNDKIFGSDLYTEGDKSIAKSMADNECILPVCISNEYNIHIGDTVTIELADNEIEYKVAAVYTDPFETSTAFDSDILINKIPDVKSSLDIFVYGKDNVTGAQIVDSYRETYNDVFNGLTFTLDDRISNGLIVGRIIGAMFLSIGVIMLLVSALMIYYMIKNAMLADAKSIAVYKTMGYTSNDILFMYLKLYFVVVTLACILGLVCSVFISNNILSSIYENMGQLKVNSSLLSGIVCYLIITSFIIFIITMIITKTKGVKPVHALNGADYGGIKKKKRYKGNSKLQFSAFGIAYRTFAREKKNAVSIIITCIVTIFSINFIVISLDVANTMKNNNDFWIGVDKSDVMISIPDTHDFDNVNKIVKQDSRTKYCLGSNFNPRVTMKWTKGISTTSMTAFVYRDFEEANLPVTDGRNPKAADEIAITTKMAEELHKNIGDYIEIYLAEDTRADMLITGFFQSYMQFGRLCRLTTSAYTERNCEFSYNNISVYLKDSKDTNNFIKNIKIQIGGKGNVIKRTEQFASIMNMIISPQQKAIPPVASLIILIAAINIFSIVFLKNLKAQKINGIYKCIGYTTWHLIFSNLCYVIGISLVSVVIAFPLTLFTYTPIMKLSLSAFHFTEYPMQVNTAHLLLANAIIIIIFIISTLASSKALYKVNARDLVQE
jgi:putative ABC transport system permease protein